LSEATETLFTTIIPRAAIAPEVKNFFLNYFPAVMLEWEKETFKIFYIDKYLARNDPHVGDDDDDDLFNTTRAASMKQMQNFFHFFNYFVGVCIHSRLYLFFGYI
jgi:hypothetical protein